MSFNRTLREFNTLHVTADNIPLDQLGRTFEPPAAANNPVAPTESPPAYTATTQIYTATAFYNNVAFFTPSTSFQITDQSQIAVVRAEIPFSWFNVSSERQNNRFSYVWPANDASGSNGAGREYICIMPDGHYTIKDINSFMQYCMIRNGHFLINAQGQNVFYLELVSNSTTGFCQINSYPLPTVTTTLSGTTGYTNWTYGVPQTVQPIPEVSYPQGNYTSAGVSFAGMTNTSSPTSGSPLNGKVPLFGMPVVGKNVWPFSVITGFPETTTTLTTFRSDSVRVAGQFFPSSITYGTATYGSPVQSSWVGTDIIAIDKEKELKIHVDRAENPFANTDANASNTGVGRPGKSVIGCVSLLDKNFGETLIYESKGDLVWLSLSSGNLHSLKFQITDENGSAIRLNDPFFNIECYITNLIS